MALPLKNGVKKSSATAPGSSYSSANSPKKRKDRNPVASKTFLETSDAWIGARLNLVFYIAIFLTVMIGALLFDVKISTGGDDSGYIEMANDFLKGRSFPTWHGPLYAIILSFIIWIFGINLIWLKLFSFLFIVLHLTLFYHTFKRIIAPSIFAPLLLIISLNSTILYFASQTYTEAMYMFLQSLLVFLFIRFYLSEKQDQKGTLKEQYLQWLILGFSLFAVSLTREIGIISLFIIVLMLLLDKNFRSSVMVVVSYLIFLLPYKLYQNLVWGVAVSKTSRPMHEILLKNFYKPESGYENFSGMVVRLFENARLYLSKHFMIGIGLMDPESTQTSWIVTILIIVFLLIALYFAFRRSKVMLFIALNLGCSMGATFLALQQHWDQMRMVIIYIPLILLLMAWSIEQLSKVKGLGFVIVLLPIFLSVVFFKTLGQTVEKIKVNQKVLAKNIDGDLYYGFTPDWQNFLIMSEWVGKNIPSSKVVASRKPSMSFIYSKGRDFFGMYRLATSAPEQFLGALKKRTGELTIIPNKALNVPAPVDLGVSLRKAKVGCVVEGTDIFGVYEFKGIEGKNHLLQLRQLNIQPLSTDSLLRRVRTSTLACYAISPDTLVSDLHNNKIDYVLVSSLRGKAKMKSEIVINNIQRHLFFIEQKYPGVFKLVYQVGGNEEEPSWLYEVDYHKLGFN
jgi:hypothetical protein